MTKPQSLPHSPRRMLIAQGLISAMMACLMTGIFGLVSHGVTPEFPALWGRAFVMAWPLAFVLSLVVGPLAFRMAARLDRMIG